MKKIIKLIKKNQMLIMFILGGLLGSFSMGYLTEYSSAIVVSEHLTNYFEDYWTHTLAGTGMTLGSLVSIAMIEYFKSSGKSTRIKLNRESKIKSLIRKRNAYYAVGKIEEAKEIELYLESIKRSVI